MGRSTQSRGWRSLSEIIQRHHQQREAEYWLDQYGKAQMVRRYIKQHREGRRDWTDVQALCAKFWPAVRHPRPEKERLQFKEARRVTRNRRKAMERRAA